VLRLEQPALSIRGRVVDQHGEPLADAWVDLLDGTPWGLARAKEGALEPMAEYTWEQLADRSGFGHHVQVDAQGHFEIRELSERSYQLVAFGPRSLHSTCSPPVAAGSSDVEMVIDTTARRVRVAGRVHDSSGTAVVGAQVSLGASVPWNLDAEGELETGTGRSAVVLSDVQGRFEFLDMSPDANYISVEPPSAGFMRAYAFVSQQASAEEIDVLLPRVTFMRLELSAGVLKSGETPYGVDALDQNNKTLSSSIGGVNVSVDFPDGRYTRVFPIADTARFLRVRTDGTSELRIPVQLKHGEINVIRY
jgi:hypothetical protein